METKLKERWWWRFLVVVYVIAWLISVTFVSILAEQHLPHTAYLLSPNVPVELGSWSEVVTTLLAGFALAFVLIESTKSALLYILGVNIWKGLLRYPKMILNRYKMDTNAVADSVSKKRHSLNFIFLILGALMMLSGVNSIVTDASSTHSYLAEGGVLVFCGALAYLSRRKLYERSSDAWQITEIVSIAVFIILLNEMFSSGGIEAAYNDPLIFYIIPALACVSYILAWKK